MSVRARRTIARRIVLSFAVALVAFAITLGFGVRALWQSQRDVAHLSERLVPVALKLGQLRSTQAALATMVDGVSEERDPASTRHLFSTLVSARGQLLAELDAELTRLPAESAAGQLRERLAALDAHLEQDLPQLEQLFLALASKNESDVARLLVVIGAIEHDASAELRAMSQTVSDAIAALSAEGQQRVTWSLIALLVLALGTLGLGVLVALHTQSLLRPLEALRARVRAVAAGDRTPRTVGPIETEIGELEVGFEQMVDALEQEQGRRLSAERFAAIGKMAAHVTHEIRNPLNSISLNLELLEDGAEDRDLLRAVRREVGRLESLSEEYLRLARLPSPRTERGDVAALVRKVVDFEAAECTRAGVHVALEIDDALPAAAFDEGQLRQALMNLLRNAREAMPGGGTIEIAVAPRALEVTIEVRDRGSGIPEEIRAQVFDPFFSTKGEGTGLGLSITKQIVEGHGGRIEYAAREGGGSVFCIHLPLALGL